MARIKRIDQVREQVRQYIQANDITSNLTQTYDNDDTIKYAIAVDFYITFDKKTKQIDIEFVDYNNDNE